MNLQQTAARIEKLLESRGLDGYEIMLGASRNLSIEVKEQMVDTFLCSEPVEVSVRVLKAGGMGFSYSTSLDGADLSRMIDSAIVGAETQTPDDCHGFPLPREYAAMPDICDPGLEGAPTEDKIGRALELERLVLAADPRVRRVRKSAYRESSFSVFLCNSKGVTGSYAGTSVSSSVSAVAESDGDSQMGWDFGFSNFFAGVDIEAIARSAARKATGLLGAGKIVTMRCPAVLDNHVAAEMLEVLAPSFLAESVHKGKSLLAGRVGERLFAPGLNIRDDGALAGGMATAPFDGEGAPQSNTPLVMDGTLQGYLYDTFYARKMGGNSTGNAGRGGVKSPPRLAVSNFFIENGKVLPEALFAGIGRGVMITGVMGMHTANPISGDFSVGAAGFLIENGVLTTPIKGIAIAGNILELFGSVEMAANDLRFFGVVGAPSIRIAALDVSGE
jgi:PmbA protein